MYKEKSIKLKNTHGLQPDFICLIIGIKDKETIVKNYKHNRGLQAV